VHLLRVNSKTVKLQVIIFIYHIIQRSSTVQCIDSHIIGKSQLVLMVITKLLLCC